MIVSIVRRLMPVIFLQKTNSAINKHYRQHRLIKIIRNATIIISQLNVKDR